jgi:hypothetical protein
MPLLLLQYCVMYLYHLAAATLTPQEALQQYENGKSTWQMHQETGLPPYVIRNWIKELGGKIRTPEKAKGYRKSHPMSSEMERYVVELFTDYHWPVSEIVKQTKLPESKVRRILVLNGLSSTVPPGLWNRIRVCLTHGNKMCRIIPEAHTIDPKENQ